jgi:branched-chain amino acid transport system ATP-binding protein
MLAVRGLAVSFGEVPAVRGVDLDVAGGEVLAVLGRNGAGKTTTLRAIAGLIPPDAGTIVFEGGDVTRLPAERRVRRGIVLVPEGRRLFPGMSVRDNLAVGAFHRQLHGRALDEEIERATEHLPVVRDRIGQRAGSLSGGEQQLVAVARALMARPRLLLADEPSLGLAPIVVERVYELFSALRDEGLTIVVVEQYVTVALGLADRAVVIDKGRVALEGTAVELAASPELIDTYLANAPEVLT